MVKRNKVFLSGVTTENIEPKHKNVCKDINSLLDISQWPEIVFFKDRLPGNSNDEEGDALGIDEGISEGGMYAAQSFAKRVLESGFKEARPLSIAVTGNSFTIGSNCGENMRQPSDECAWPSRLARRWTEVVTRSLGNATDTNTKIEWRMLQENAQGSNNVAHRLPSLIDEYHSENKTLDVIILNNGLSDNMEKPWLEAIVRVLLEQFPQNDNIAY
jgi:hypothetical protein